MPKFKDIDFDRTEVILLSDGSYLLIGSDHKENKQLFETIETLFASIERGGSKAPTVLLGYAVSRKDFNFLADTMEEGIEDMHLDSNCIVLYDADRYCRD